MSATHARFAPSSLALIVACHAHLMMAEPYKNGPPTPESLEGDAAHWVNLQYVTTSAMPAVGTITPAGLAVDDDMQAAARLWFHVVGEYGISETMVPIQRLHPTLCYGTPDWWRYDPIEGVLRVADFKYGHLFVDAFENWQLMAYAIGLLDFLGLDDTAIRVELIVVQPRNYDREGPVRRWEIRGSDLRGYANRAVAAIELSTYEKPSATVGEHCNLCEGRHECKALQRAVMAGASYVSGTERVNMPPDAIGVELTILDQMADLLKARRTGLQEQAQALIKSGVRVPGYAIEHAVGRLKWVKPVTEVFTLGDLMQVNLRKEPEAITPTQAIALGLPAEMINGTFAERAAGAAKLVSESTTQTRKVFGANAL